MAESQAARLVRQLGLQAHPEGGHYRETYRSAGKVNVPAGERSASTAIYYLLEGAQYSAWHRIASDELWHFYAGSPLNVYVLDGKGELKTYRLGNSLTDTDCVFQAVVPAGCWFAAELARNKATETSTRDEPPFALVGCTVAPGFEFSEFELADTFELAAKNPQHVALLRRLCSRQ